VILFLFFCEIDYNSLNKAPLEQMCKRRGITSGGKLMLIFY
jgi:hypothetical protein